jgi:aspartate/methionine/tyrosine aminotransferase
VRGALGLGPEFDRDLSDHYLKRRDFLVAGLEDAGFRCHLPKGAYYVMADVADIIRRSGRPNRFRDDAELARYLVSEVKVAAVPGSSFYKSKAMASGKGAAAASAGIAHKLRFCFCKKEETLSLAVERLREFRRSL